MSVPELGPARLGWCTNVLPEEHPTDLLRALHDLENRFPPPRRGPGDPRNIGLRLGERAVRAFAEDPDLLPRFRAGLAERGFEVFTLNVFPQGVFHDPVVKERVYAPDWTTAARRDYTIAAARVLAALLPEERPFGSLSTVPIGHRAGPPEEGLFERAAIRLLEVADALAEIEVRTQRCLRLGLEPEPTCLLETTPQTIRFFEEELWPRAARQGEAALSRARRHLGVCLDACHQAVLYEDVVNSRDALVAAGIGIVKIQVSCALGIVAPGTEGEDAARLGAFAEPRFLHQVAARDHDGGLLRFDDLPAFLADLESLAPRLESARAHYHVPVHRPPEGRPGTTRASLEALLAAERAAPSTSDYEVETYTFSLLPRTDDAPRDLAEDLESELRFTRTLRFGPGPAPTAPGP